MPAGMLISMVLWWRTLPVPLHAGHGSSITLPVPPQRSQVRVVCTMPNGVRWLTRTWPAPSHCGHVRVDPFFAPVPWHSAHVSTCS